MTIISLMAVGFVAHDGDVVWGVGNSIEEVIETTFRVRTTDVNLFFSVLDIAPASAALIDVVQEKGGCAAFGEAANGVLGTSDEVGNGNALALWRTRQPFLH